MPLGSIITDSIPFQSKKSIIEVDNDCVISDEKQQHLAGHLGIEGVLKARVFLGVKQLHPKTC